MGRFSALRLHPRPFGGEASLVSSASSSHHFPVGRGGPARLFRPRHRSLAALLAPAGRARSSIFRLGGTTPIGSSTSPSPTHRWGREGGASQAFSLAQALARLARRRRLALQPCPYPLANGAERRFSAAAALQPRSRRLALRPLPRPLIMSGRGITRLINFALAHLPV